MFLRRANCSVDTFRLFIADKNAGGTYVPVDITSNTSLQNLRQDQSSQAVSYMTLSPDGLSIIAVTGDGRRLVASKRSALGATDFGAPSDSLFLAINDAIGRTSGVLADPVVSGDGLALYAHVINDLTVNGLYESVRQSTASSFPAATLMPPVLQTYQAVKGVSADRLTLFLFDISTSPWSTAIFTRKDPSQAYANPNAPNPPPRADGFRNVPTQDCGVLVGNYTTSGCLGEDIYLINAL